MFSKRPQGDHIVLAKLVIRNIYSKISLKQPLKRRPKIVFQDRLSLNVGKLPSVFKTFVLSIFKWPLKTGLTKTTDL